MSMADETQYPWEQWDDATKERAKRAIQYADMAMNYHQAGHMAKPGSKEVAQALAQRGGLTPEEALNLARYKMFLETTGGDPGWQGPLNINAGEREQVQSPDELNQALAKASPEGKKQIWNAQEQSVKRSPELLYDKLVQQQAPKPISNEVNDAPIKLAQPATVVASLKSGKVGKYVPTAKAETDDDKLVESQLLMLQQLLAGR